MKRVLIIDDDKSVLTALGISLRRQGFLVSLADGGVSGVAAMEMADFDLVMLDIFMPEMDGLEVIKVFKKRAPGLPIIAMSGFRFLNAKAPAAPDFLEMAVQLGATYRLRKPFAPWQLKTAVDACLP